MTRQKSKTYLGPDGIAFNQLPVLNGEKIEGVIEGRIVAYWPTRVEARGSTDPNPNPAAGLWRPIGVSGFIPAMIVASWNSEPTEGPHCNLALQLDPSNHQEAIRQGLTGAGSRHYSEVPAQGCWTWVPKA